MHSPPSRREHLQAIALAFACSVLFLRDALLPDRALVPFAPELHDVQLLEAQARARHANEVFDVDAILRGHVGMGDKYFQSLCWDRVLRDRLRAGEVPLWTRDIGGGAPVAAQFAQPFHPSNALLLWLSAERFYGWTLLLHQVLFGWFAYAFFRRVRCGHGAAMVAVVTSVLGLWLQAHVHHNVVISAAMPVWCMLLLTHRLTEANAQSRWRDAMLLALATGLSWLSGFAIVSLQATYLCVAMAVVRTALLPSGSRLRTAGAFAIAMLCAAAISLANVVPMLLAYADSSRRAAFDERMLSASGLETAHLLSLLWPDLLSRAADHIYPAVGEANAAQWLLRPQWSQLVLLKQPTHALDGSSHQVWVETCYAIGAVGTLTACLAFCRAGQRRLATFFAVALVVAFAIACASTSAVACTRWLPGLQAGDLRRCLFVVSLALTALSTLGVQAVLTSARRPRLLLASASLVVLLVSLLGLLWLWQHADANQFVAAMAAMYGEGDAAAVAAEVHKHAAPGEIANNQVDLLTTLLRTAVVAAGLVVVAVVRPSWRAALLVLLAVAELLHLSQGPVQTVAAAKLRRPPAVLAPVVEACAAVGPAAARPRMMRLMPRMSRLDQGLPGNFPGYLGIEDAGFYCGVASRRAAEFFTAIEPNASGKSDVAYRSAGVGAFHVAASLDHVLCDLFGIRFVMSAVPLPASARCVDRTPEHTGGFRLYERTTTLPRATFCTAVDVRVDRDARLAELARTERRVAHRVVLESDEAPKLVDPTVERESPASAQVLITEHRDERVVVTVTNEREGYLRLADPFDPGWTATVDGERRRVWVADHYLRAVYLPPGTHEVVFAFDAPRVLWPLWGSLFGLLATVGLLAWSWRQQRAAGRV